MRGGRGHRVRRGRRAGTALGVLAAIAGLAAAGCGSANAPVFRPAGSLHTPAPAVTSSTATAGPGGFRFPAGVSVQLAPAAPAGAGRRAILAGYQDYVLSLWAGVLSRGRDAAYRGHLSGNALGFARREIRFFRSHHRTIRGTIRYFNIAVTSVYFGAGANVTACVDATGFRVVSTRTGAVLGPVFPRRYAHYLEDVAEGKSAGGRWQVIQTQAYPASTSEGAMCR